MQEENSAKKVQIRVFSIFVKFYLEKTDGLFVKALRCVVEDALQRPLDDTASPEDALAELDKSLSDLQRKHVM